MSMDLDLEITRTEQQYLEDFMREDQRVAEATATLVSDFHKTLNVVSGVMAAGIVLGGGELESLELPMKLALVAFVVSLSIGLLFLHFLFLSHRQYRRRMRVQVVEKLQAMDSSPPFGEITERRSQAIGHTRVPVSRWTNLARISQIVAVAVGFGLVFWGFGTGFFPDMQP